MSVLMFKSEDGQEYNRVAVFPDDWDPDVATDLAIEAFTAAQTRDPLDWSWEDIEPELIARGFSIPCWYHGPTWDRQRVPAKEFDA